MGRPLGSGIGQVRVVAPLAAVLLFLAPAASAAAPEPFFQIPPESSAAGSGAGQLSNPRDVAASSDGGHLYVSDSVNARISEFTPWGEFVKAWGWDVSPDGAPGDTAADRLEVCTAECQAGVEGDGAGQINGARGIAVDGAGDVYVYEAPLASGASRRVQKFDGAGNFLLMFGGQVKKGPGNPGDVCTAAHLGAGDTCGNGVSGTADGWFSSGNVGNYLTYSPVTDTVLVGDVDRIQEFEPDGSFKAKIDFEGALSPFDGETVRALAADPVSGDLYVGFSGGLDTFYRLDPATSGFEPIEVEVPETPATDPDGDVEALATGPEGNVYVVWNFAEPFVPTEVVGIDPSGKPIPGMGPGDGFGAVGDKTTLLGIEANLCPGSEAPGNLYASRFSGGDGISYVSAYGTPPIGCEDPPVVPPAIEAQYAVSVDTDAAVLKAQINPRFWADTTYYLQYGTTPCSAGGCGAEKPAPPGARLTEKVVNATVTSAGVFLADLEPDTTYRYRFVAQSGGSSGEPVIGVNGKPGEPGAEGTFTTFPLPTPRPSPDPCPNAEFRNGPGALLPDCRAYEMVSPLEKNNNDIVVAPVQTSDEIPARLQQSSVSGDRLTYSSSTAFGNPDSAPYTSQYLAQRQPPGHPEAGWSSEAISPPRTQKVTLKGFDVEFKAFSADLCTAWLRSTYDPPLDDEAVPLYPNIYRRGNCEPGRGGYEGLTPIKPGLPPQDEDFTSALDLQGTSADGGVAFYVAPDDLPGTGAPANGNLRPQLYVRANGGPVRFACILPNGSPSPQACYAGTRADVGNRHSSLHNAVSRDGSRVFWTAASVTSGPGRIFLRDRAEQGAVAGECTEAGRPCTREVSPAGSKARFWSAAADGSKAIYSIDDSASVLDRDLYVFDAESGETTLIAGGTLGVLGAAEDASHVYFVSTEALGGANGEGDAAREGAPNLYLFEQGAGTTFVGTLGPADVDVNALLSPISRTPFNHSARVTPDGRHAAFMSTASLTGYDNLDAASGEPDTEVFLYDADSATLRCVSCNLSGARPLGREFRKSSKGVPVWIAAQIPGFESVFHAPRVLADDGERLFFESNEALVVRDTNGARDVYQWQRVAGAGAAGREECEDVGADLFVERAGGCISLISSGESGRDSSFVDADPSGKDVFFATLSSLVPRDYGLVDIYDARVGGGFSAPVAPAECEGEACQSPPPPPAAVTPASSAFRGKGNPTARPRRCAAGKRRVVRRGKARCMKKHRRARAKSRGKGAHGPGRARR